MIRRSIEESVRQAMADTPVVLVNGARQTGKTTLAQAIPGKTGAHQCNVCFALNHADRIDQENPAFKTGISWHERGKERRHEH